MLTEHDTRALEAVRSSLNDAVRAVQSAQAALDAGRAVDLRGMDARVEQLCARALGLPPPLSRAALPDLVALSGKVDALIERLANTRPAR